MAVDKEEKKGFWNRHRKVWLWLFLTWTMLYLDRAVTGPVVSWMITNEVSFMAGAPMPHALGGVIGGMFFAGYMLTQFPAGYLGDKYGRKPMIIISAVWSGLATLMTGLASTLTAFVVARVLTGLGEGAYYSNDRALIFSVTPAEKRGVGMGVVFVGLSLGLTIATLGTPYLLDWSASMWGKEVAWTVPFFVLAVPTLLVAYGVWKYVDADRGRIVPAAVRLMAYSAVFLVIIMATYLATLELGLSGLMRAVLVTMTALALIAVIYFLLGKESSPVLHDRNLMLMYISAIPILYTLWFFAFWSLLVVSEAASIGLSGAAVYAALFGVANAIGYPLGGVISDYSRRRGLVRSPYLVMCSLVLGLVIALGWYISHGGNDVLVLGSLMFLMGVPFAGMQTVHMTLTADLAPPTMMAQTFGMWNLVAQIGAVLSPVIAGTLRDITGDWTLAIYVNAAMLGASFLLVAVVKKKND